MTQEERFDELLKVLKEIAESLKKLKPEKHRTACTFCDGSGYLKITSTGKFDYSRSCTECFGGSVMR